MLKIGAVGDDKSRPTLHLSWFPTFVYHKMNFMCMYIDAYTLCVQQYSIHSSVCTATLVELGLSLVGNICRGNVWPVDNRYVGSIIITGILWSNKPLLWDFPWKLAMNEIEGSCNSRILNGELMTIKQEIIMPRSLSCQMSLLYIN